MSYQKPLPLIIPPPPPLSSISYDQHQQIVRENYASVGPKTKKDRNKTEMKPLRKVQNFIMTSLLRYLLEPMPHPIQILELAMGKGGSLTKLMRLNFIENMVGIDTTHESVVDATDRYYSLLRENPWMRMSATFIHDDCFFKPIESVFQTYENDNKDLNVKLPREYDAVSCQMAFHYACNTKEIMETAISNMAESVRKMGLVILTFPNAAYITQLLTYEMSIRPTSTKIGDLCTLSIEVE